MKVISTVIMSRLNSSRDIYFTGVDGVIPAFRPEYNMYKKNKKH